MENNGLLSQGVSIMTCTKRAGYIQHLLNNYSRQMWPQKELIVILNNDQLSLNRYRRAAKRYKNVSIYQLPQGWSLGRCLNFAVRKSKYNYVAKFDDDDYYAPRYISETMRAFRRAKAAVVGKLTIYTYLQHRKLLLLRYPNKENRYVHRIGGGTIAFKKSVFQFAKFPDVSLGEDVGFQQRCRANGCKIYSTSRYNFVGVRRQNNSGHTWKVSDRQLMANSRIVAKTTDYRPFAERPT
ncbi:glycosyltransferase [Alicyclobacillus ferrooxydans]|uniref:Glycosyl transferase family 2 n=1 Tax=Alicyclobacillus ferrooxydans TaxID=471514 RepID=A0A0P9ENR8_9BACL|nr:glycosyltransferase [Alicyclobacillus ferrooxydans]KPV45106.1 glycosyl transferase family 2 [Alicyclobacillus ferrooxydans]